MAFPRERFGGSRARSRRRPAEDESDRFLDGEEDAADWEDTEVEGEEEEEDAYDERPRRRLAAPPRRRAGAMARKPGRSRMDWEEAGEDDETGEEDFGYEEQELSRKARRRRPSGGDSQPASAASQPRRRLRLMDLCTPVFACTALLPRGTGAAMQPAYASFRQEVMTALQRIEREAQNHGIDREDAKDAVYALALFVDEQVAGSQWTAREQWSAEPLHIVINQDSEGGENFFRKLREMGDRRRAAKEVYLVCLAFGYRGKYATMDQVQQAAQLAEERQRILREIHPTPMERMRRLFPEAYTPANPLQVRVPPPPTWWWIASGAAVFVCLVIWIVLFLNVKPEPGTVEAVRTAGSSLGAPQ